MTSFNQNRRELPNSDYRGSWSGIDTESLDQWLENNLKQPSLSSTACPSQQHSKTQKDYTISLQDQTDNSRKDVKAEESDIMPARSEENNLAAVNKANNFLQSNAKLPHLLPMIKAYSVLNIIKQNKEMEGEEKNTQRNYTPPLSPSDIENHSNFSGTCAHKDSSVKKKQKTTRSPVDVSAKRQRNTDAARRSRLRKMIKMETLEQHVEVLKSDNERLQVTVAVLESDINHAIEKEARNRQRVVDLEIQLANSHKQLIQDYQQNQAS